MYSSVILYYSNYLLAKAKFVFLCIQISIPNDAPVAQKQIKILFS